VREGLAKIAKQFEVKLEVCRAIGTKLTNNLAF
jgi:hypothetical protein